MSCYLLGCPPYFTWIVIGCLLLLVNEMSVLDPGKGICADPRRGDATLGAGGPGPPMGTMSVSWVRTGEERRRSKMSENKEDNPITASRNVHAQSKCHCASISNSVTYPLQELYFIVLLFQEINNLVLVPFAFILWCTGSRVGNNVNVLSWVTGAYPVVLWLGCQDMDKM